MKEYLRAVGAVIIAIVAVLFSTGVLWIGYQVTAVFLGMTRGETATAILVIALVAGAVKAYRERRRQGVRREAMAKQRYEMPPEEWKRLQPFYVLTVEALKNERDRTEKRGGTKKNREPGEDQ